MNVFIFLCFLHSFSTKSIMFTAFDCNSDESPPTYSSSSVFCAGARVKNISSLKISLIQATKTQMVNAIECSMSMSVSSHLCGFESHNHIVEADTISKSVRLSSRECLTAFNEKRLFFENRVLHVKSSFDNRFKYFLNGSVTLSYNILNQQILLCTPSGIWVNNNFLVDGYQSVEIVFHMEQIKLLRQLHGFSTLDGKFIGECEGGCFYKSRTYALTDRNSSIEDKILNSKFKFIRDMTVDKIKMGNSFYLRNISEGFYIKVGKQIRECFADHCVKFYSTEIENLLIFSERNIFPAINVFEIDLSMEAKLEITSETRLLINLIDNQPFLINLCKSLANPGNLHNTIEQFGRLVEFRGELIIFHHCKKKHFSVELDIPYPCFKNIFTFEVNNKLIGVSPFTRIIVDVDYLQSIECNTLPTFISLSDISFAVNMGKGIEIKYFNLNGAMDQEDFVIKDLFSNKERVQSSLDISRKFDEIQTNLYLSQLTNDQLDSLHIQPGFWNDVSSYISSFSFLNPFSWLKLIGAIIGLVTLVGIIWLIFYFGIKTIFNLKCFEHRIVLNQEDQEDISLQNND
jgi:hypothetical protein